MAALIFIRGLTFLKTNLIIYIFVFSVLLISFLISLKAPRLSKENKKACCINLSTQQISDQILMKTAGWLLMHGTVSANQNTPTQPFESRLIFFFF